MSQKREWLADIVESVPSIVFLALWRSGWDLELTGWIGAALAAIALVGLRSFRRQYNPILLGINVHLLTITPLIITLFYVGAEELSETLVALSYRGVLVTVFLVGCALTAGSKRGFIGIDSLPTVRRRAYSLILLAASAASIVWAFAFASTASTLISVAVPMVALFGLRRLLIAHWDDHSGQINGIVSVGSSVALTTDPAEDAV